MGKVKQWFKKTNKSAKGYFYVGFTLGLMHWFANNWPNLLTAPVYSLWIFLLYAIGFGLVGKLSELKLIKLSKKEKDNLEMLLKKKGLEFEIFNPISQENLNNIIERLYETLEFYLDIAGPQNPIEYYPEKQVFKIFYDGKLKSKEIILKILTKKFRNDFTIKSII